MIRHLVLLATVLVTTLSHAAVTWQFTGSPPADKQAAITSAMNTAVSRYNTYANYNANITVAYNAGVPTAQASYQGWIEFGGSINARVAQHEMAHWFGTGTYWDWNNHRSGGQWTGTYALAKVRAYDGNSATIGCDAAHFWPYGWNYDSEGTFPERNVGIVGGFRRDMGLSDNTIGIAPGQYRLQNRSSGKMLDNMGATTDGANVCQWESSASNNQKWNITLISGGYFKLQCVTGGKYLDSIGRTTDGSAIGQWGNGGSWNQQWSIVQTDSGYYKIINRANGKCLDTGGQTANGSVMQHWYSGSSHNQHWKFVK